MNTGELYKLIVSSDSILIAACIFAYLFGAIHTFLPGHGKTIVCGYCIGKKRDTKKILFISAVTVATHLFSSAVLGVVAMASSRVLVINVIFPKIQLGAAVVLIIFGLALTGANIRKYLKQIKHKRQHSQGNFHEHLHQHGSEHDHEHTHTGEKLDSLINDYMAEEKPEFHSKIKLMWLGIAAGAIPCIEPFTLMVFAIAMNKIAIGFLFLISFGLGVFTTVVLLGMLLTSPRLTDTRVSEKWYINAAHKLAKYFSILYPLVIIGLGVWWIEIALKR